ncbi:MAG: hypothetical protein WD827_06565 [Solirubrobacterales bacterium]
MDRSPSTDEAAAIAAAIERFRAETAPAAPATDAIGSWQRTALAEGVGAKETVQEHREGGSKWLS